MLLLRWAFSSGHSLVERRPDIGSPEQYGLLVAVAEPRAEAVAALGAAYLGGTRLGVLAAAGLVTEQRDGALNALSAALTWDPAPWCPVIF